MVFFQTLKLQTPFLKPKMNHQRAMIFVDTSLIPLNTRKKGTGKHGKHQSVFHQIFSSASDLDD